MKKIVRYRSNTSIYIEFIPDPIKLTKAQVNALALLWMGPRIGKNLIHHATRKVLHKLGLIEFKKVKWPKGDKMIAYRITNLGQITYEEYADEMVFNKGSIDDDSEFEM